MLIKINFTAIKINNSEKPIFIHKQLSTQIENDLISRLAKVSRNHVVEVTHSHAVVCGKGIRHPVFPHRNSYFSEHSDRSIVWNFVVLQLHFVFQRLPIELKLLLFRYQPNFRICLYFLLQFHHRFANRDVNAGYLLAVPNKLDPNHLQKLPTKY